MRRFAPGLGCAGVSPCTAEHPKIDARHVFPPRRWLVCSVTTHELPGL